MPYNNPDVWAFTLALILVGSIFAYILYIEKKRRQELKKQARRIGFSFSPNYQGNIPGNKEFRIFNIGHSKKAYNLLKGTYGKTYWEIFDYNYTVGAGRNSSTYTQTIIYTQVKDFNFPHFTLDPEGFFHKIAQALGFKDINFEANPEFSKKYLLKGENEEKIRELFAPHILRFFEKMKKPIHIEAKGNNFLLWSRPRIKPQELRNFLDQTNNILNLFTNKT